MQLGVNHLGHFALTGLLIGALKGRDDARVVTVSSTAHRFGRIAFDNLQGERRYFRWRAYGQSKLANLLFAFELDRRLRAAGSTVSSNAAHPGYAATELQSSGPPAFDTVMMRVGNRLVAQSAEMGALPDLYAATQPGLVSGTFAGPDGLGEQRGYPKAVGSSAAARDEEVATRLWSVSEQLTGVALRSPRRDDCVRGPSSPRKGSGGELLGVRPLAAPRLSRSFGDSETARRNPDADHQPPH